MKNSDWYQQPNLEAQSDISTIEESPVSQRRQYIEDVPIPKELFAPEATKSPPPQKRRFLKWIGIILFCDLSLGSLTKWFQDSRKYPAGLKHGTVIYSSNELDVYQREISAPCGYGILTFTVGPAHPEDDFSFDLYSTEFSFYQGSCFLKPIFQASHLRNYPFTGPLDPAKLPVSMHNEITRISSTLLGEEMEDIGLSQRCGEYAVIAKGSFFNPAYFDELAEMVHTWTIAEIEAEDFKETVSERDSFSQVMEASSRNSLRDGITSLAFQENVITVVAKEEEYPTEGPAHADLSDCIDDDRSNEPNAASGDNESDLSEQAVVSPSSKSQIIDPKNSTWSQCMLLLVQRYTRWCFQTIGSWIFGS